MSFFALHTSSCVLIQCSSSENSKCDTQFRNVLWSLLFYVLFVSIVLFYLLFVSIVLFYVLFVSIVFFYVLFVSIVLFYALFVRKCVLYYCHRVATQLQLHTSYHITLQTIFDTSNVCCENAHFDIKINRLLKREGPFLSSHRSAVTRYTPSVLKWEINFYSTAYRFV